MYKANKGVFVVVVVYNIMLSSKQLVRGIKNLQMELRLISKQKLPFKTNNLWLVHNAINYKSGCQ